jgi:hypothetical protein
MVIQRQLPQVSAKYQIAKPRIDLCEARMDFVGCSGRQLDNLRVAEHAVQVARRRVRPLIRKIGSRRRASGRQFSCANEMKSERYRVVRFPFSINVMASTKNLSLVSAGRRSDCG